jgi:hypothetical protein
MILHYQGTLVHTLHNEHLADVNEKLADFSCRPVNLLSILCLKDEFVFDQYVVVVAFEIFENLIVHRE